MDPFLHDLESLFLEEDAVFTEFAIKDKNTAKYKSALVEDTKWSVLVKDKGKQLSSLGNGSQGSDQDS